MTDGENNGNGETKVTLAIVRNDVSNLRTTLMEWRAEDMRYRGSLDDRLLEIEKRVLSTETLTAASVEERRGLRRDVDNLAVRVTAWDLINSVAGGILALIVMRKP